MARPELIIADEPTAGLDAALKGDILDLLLAPGPRARGLLLISHDLPMVMAYSNRIAVMLGGRLIESFARKELGQRAHHPYTRSLFSAAGLLERSAGPTAPHPGRGSDSEAVEPGSC